MTLVLKGRVRQIGYAFSLNEMPRSRHGNQGARFHLSDDSITGKLKHCVCKCVRVSVWRCHGIVCVDSSIAIFLMNCVDVLCREKIVGTRFYSYREHRPDASAEVVTPISFFFIFTFVFFNLYHF